ncbi:MAG TPA: hypothetical protein VF144_04450 [Chitinophagaceae bacterium]
MQVIIFYACKKERSCEGCRNGNKPPIAVAGPDQLITFPLDSSTIDGSASNDPDGTISEWLWKKISGPASSTIANVTTAKTIVRNLDTGIYRFELIVKDNGGLLGKDTVQITVNSSPQLNRPPIAIAGADQTITLPATTITLNGSASTDPDNNITGYTWTKILGPVTFNIVNAVAVQTQVTNFVQGVYQFELTVTDAGGLFSRDTAIVNVNAASIPACNNLNRPTVNAQLVPVTSLSSVPWAMTSVGNKIAFIGEDSIHFYDAGPGTWSKVKLNLSVPRYAIAVVGAGNKIFFAGGEDGTLLHNVVDIYDLSTDTWTVSQLSRVGDAFSTATCGNKVFFTGGNQGINVPNTVDIYDLTTNSWSAAALSSARNFITAISSGNKVYFTGGDPWLAPVSNAIDIYDHVTNTWSTSTMQLPRVFHAGVVSNDVLYLAGGQSSALCSVETWNTITGERTVMQLFGPASWATYQAQNAVIRNNKIIYLRHGGGSDATKFDIFDIQTNLWSIGLLPQQIPDRALVISVNNVVYIAGGDQNNQVWKLEF